MSLESRLEHGVEKVLKTNTVSGAQKVLSSRSGISLIALISFIESSLPLPIMTDPFLVAAILSERKNTFKLILTTTVTSVLGGMFAFFAAAYFFDFIHGLMSESVANEFYQLSQSGDTSTLMLTLVGAITPIPYTIVAWVVAVLKGSLLVFIIASFLGRGFRYLVVGYCTYKFGPLAVTYAKKYIGVTSVLLIILVALFLWIKM